MLEVLNHGGKASSKINYKYFNEIGANNQSGRIHFKNTDWRFDNTDWDTVMETVTDRDALKDTK